MVHVGDTISDGTYTYTIIGINQDKPSDESGNLLPESSYGDVLTLMPLGALVGASNGQPVTVNRKAMPWDYPAQMNSSDTSLGGWKSTDMRKITMPQYLAKLPAETQNVIGYVKKYQGDHHLLIVQTMKMVVVMLLQGISVSSFLKKKFWAMQGVLPEMKEMLLFNTNILKV